MNSGLAMRFNTQRHTDRNNSPLGDLVKSDDFLNVVIGAFGYHYQWITEGRLAELGWGYGEHNEIRFSTHSLIPHNWALVPTS